MSATSRAGRSTAARYWGGSVSIGRQLRLHLDGSIAAWPEAWPALPTPLSQATAPMPFALDYRGGIDFADLAELELRRDEARFEARFHLPDVLAWLKARDTGSPLPPLDGTLSAPRIDIAGARLHGVEIEMEEPGVAEPAR